MERYELHQAGYEIRFYNIRGLEYDYGYYVPKTGKDVITLTNKFISESNKEIGIEDILIAGFKFVPTELVFKFELQENSLH